jgi:transposase InsO family protein
MGVSRQCAYRWLRRFEAEGEAGLNDRSSRPHRSPNQTSGELEEQVIELRRTHRRGPDWLSWQTGVPARTVTRILRRHGMARLCELDPMTGERIRATRETTVRYERERPGELIHVDVKKLGRIPDGGGWRAHGRQMGSTGERKRNKIGFDYIHSAVDDHTRLAYSEIHDDEKGATAAGFIRRAGEFFNNHGITVERVITDNHWSYRNTKAVADVIAELGATHKFIRPHCPWQNGKVERFNRTLQTEWAYAQIWTSNHDRAAALSDFIHTYNHERRHHALGGNPPISRCHQPHG